MTDRQRASLRQIIDLVAILGALAFVGSHFPASLVFAQTIATGGDMGSHYYPSQYLRGELLPRGQIIGWCPGNYCGYPMFQLYFPLPFLMAAALSLVLAPTVAFKLVTLVGTFLLPICCYLSLRLMRVPFPGPALAAVAPLSFLFLEANSVWGGNIPSTLAGEFSFSLGLSLAILFIGLLRFTMETGKARGWNCVLVALVVLSHGYAILWAGFTSLFELVTVRAWWRRLGTLVVIHGLAILLTGFFLLQLLGYSRWTTVFARAWQVRDWREALPPILWPVAVVALLGSAALLWLSLRRKQPFPRPLAVWWVGMGVAFILWLGGPTLHVVDIRFLPFLQLGLCLTGATAAGYLLRSLPGVEVVPVLAGLAMVPFIDGRVTFIPNWVEWNYSGYEMKPSWPEFKAVNAHLQGDFAAPRVVYEQAPAEYQSLGTPRAFENLPLFAGRATLGGLHIEASPTAPFIAFLQSEISADMPCPLAEYGCSRVDLKRGVDHLQLFNVSHLIARSAMVKVEAARHPGLALDRTVGPFQIFRLRENADRYALPLEVAPVLVRTDAWKEAAYRWFKRAAPGDPLPVFDPGGGGAAGPFAVADASEVLRLPRHPLLGSAPALRERMGLDRLSIEGCRPGHPLLIRVSYHPRWRALSGEKIWLAGPGLMLVVPQGDRLDLVFGSGGWTKLGSVATSLGLGMLLLLVVPVGRRWASRVVVAGIGRLPTNLASVAERTEAVLLRRWRAALLGLAVIVALLATWLLVARGRNLESVFYEADDHYLAGRLERSLAGLQRAQQMAPLSGLAIDATYKVGIIHLRAKRLADAEASFTRLLEEYPEARNAPEAAYHLGVARLERGNVAGAGQALREAHQRFPETHWGRLAGEKLIELERR